VERGGGRAGRAHLVELAGGPEVVLERNGPLVGGGDVDALALGAADPVGELDGVGGGGREEDHIDVVREHDDDLFPDHAPLTVIYIMNLVKDDPLDVSYEVGPAVPGVGRTG
jgi:hypothetical protein